MDFVIAHRYGVPIPPAVFRSLIMAYSLLRQVGIILSTFDPYSFKASLEPLQGLLSKQIDLDADGAERI
jgi:hypothetical protein